MYQTPEQLIALNKAGMEVAGRIASIAFQSTKKLIELQMTSAKAALAESATSVRALATVKDPQELASLRDRVLQPSMEKATAYAREIYGVAAAAQNELGKMVESQVAEFNKSVVTALDKAAKSAPAGSEFAVAAMRSAVAGANVAYDNMSKLSRQFADITEANVAAASHTLGGRKKAA
jgi:phasin family protein